MQDLILAVNAGSSSLKLAIFQLENNSQKNQNKFHLLLSASFSNLFTKSPSFDFKPASSDSELSEYAAEDARAEFDDSKASDHKAAFDYFLHYLSKCKIDAPRIGYIAHRVVHGGSYPSPTLISKETFDRIEELSDLAPLHNARALDVITICIQSLPTSKSYALFDTSFHTTIPDHISKYAINQEIAEKKGLRKYGFHGLSYSYILRALSTHLSKSPSRITAIILHLGSGASICAIANGKSLDTSMGLTPLDGLPGSTRSGHVDPSLIFHYTSDAGRMSQEKASKMHITEAEHILNNSSGWKSLTGTTNFGTITSSLSNPSHQLAYNLFLDRIINFLGAYILKLGGPSKIDALVFAGGIGEHSSKLRADVIAKAECVGFAYFDEFKNDDPSDLKEGDESIVQISNDDVDRVKSFVCWTDEQYEMVRILVDSEHFA